MNLKIISALIISCVIANISFADCPLAHTHIAINPTWRSSGDTDLSDDSKLWFFSLGSTHPIAPTPGWPNWGPANGDVFLQLVPVLDGGNLVMKGDGSEKHLWESKFMYSESGGYGDPAGVQHLDGWHSAHPGHGKWNLASVDQNTIPQWDIYLKREGASVASDDFFMLLPDDTEVLTADGDTYQLDKNWLPDKNAWGFHEHMSFNFWLTPDEGQEVTVTFSASDAGGLYTASDDFDMTFVTVPEPASLMLLGLGALPLLRKKCKA